MHTLVTMAVLAFPMVLCACAASHARPAGADGSPEEERAILDTLDRFFIAMAARDTEAYAALITPDGMTYTQVLRDGSWHLRSRSNRESIAWLGAGTDALRETYWDPTVMVRGPIAVVWMPYRFERSGVESHRGIDIFTLLKVEDRWVIANAMWTSEPGEDLRPDADSVVRPASMR
jgi:hypothetical protein